MKMRIIFPALSLLLATVVTNPDKVSAGDQEIGLLLGASAYQGDLSGPDFLDSRLHLDELNFAVGGFYRYYFTPRFNFKGGLYFGYISGDDANYVDEQNWRERRNLSFRSHIFEGSLQLEWNILPFVPRSQQYRFAPYVFAGISVFNFNPQAELDGEWHDLQPLGTEGQNFDDIGPDEPYALTQLSIPMGIGFKYNISGYWNLGLEIGARKTFTDYLDDVSDSHVDNDRFDDPIAAALSDRRQDGGAYREGSQRGEPDSDDWYAFTGITISYTIRSFQCNGNW